MPKTPIYLKSLELKNIKTFGEVNFDLEKEDGTLPQWTLILGDNGIGKSTLLQCAAWMKPNILVRNSGDDIDISNIHPNITNEENETIARLVRKSKSSGSIKAKFVSQRTFNKKNNSEESYCETSIDVKLINRKLSELNPNFDTNNEEVFFEEEVLIYAYSASRKIGKLNINDVDLEDTIPSFIQENTILYDAEEILHTINYATLGAKKDKAKYRKYLNEIKEVLVAVLPNFESVDDIEISSPKLINSRIQQTEVAINTKHGKSIPFNDFSLGYKTIASLIVDLSWRLINQYPKSKAPLSRPAIVIIDEIDLHLHPIWQREIINNLSNHFPKVQFIATAHSPLMVQSAVNQNFAVLFYTDEGVKIVKNPEDIDGWRVDQILTSSFFGLPSSRGTEYEYLMKQREQLINKKKLTQLDKNKLKKLNDELYNFPSGETPEEIKERKMISDLIANITKKKIKIEI